MKGFYIENFFLRLLFCIFLAVAAANLGIYVREVVISHGTYAFDLIRGLLFPTALGVLAAIMWRPKE